MKILVGTLRSAHLDRYRREIEVAVRSTGLRGAEFDYDLTDVDGAWGNGVTDADALLILSGRGLPAQAIARAKRLSFVQQLGTRDGIDIAACKSRGIAVAMVEDMNHIAVAEHTIMFMLCAARRMLEGHAAVIRADYPANVTPITTTQAKRLSNWLDYPRDAFNVLAGQTLGSIGFGDIARHVATRARCFGMKVMYTKPTRLPPEIEAKFGVVYADLPTLLREADFVSLHAILHEAGPPIMGARELALMKSTAHFINTARGNQVDQGALIDSLRKGAIAGACLDVYATEPVPAHAFDGMDNVVLTPHTAGITPWALRFREVMANFEAHFNRRPVTGLV